MKAKAVNSRGKEPEPVQLSPIRSDKRHKKSRQQDSQERVGEAGCAGPTKSLPTSCNLAWQGQLLIQALFKGSSSQGYGCGDGGEGSCGGVWVGDFSAVQSHCVGGLRGRAKGHTHTHTHTHIRRGTHTHIEEHTHTHT